MSSELLASSVLLGIVGFDPFGGFVAAAALTRRPTRVAIMGLGLGMWTATVLLGLALEAAGVQLLSATLHWLAMLPPWFWLGLQCSAGIGLTIIGAMQIRGNRAAEPSTAMSGKGNSFRFLFMAGTLVAVSQVPDPAFIALIAINLAESGFIDQVVSLTVWSLLSQLALYVLVAAGLLRMHHRAAQAFDIWWRRRHHLIMGCLGALLVSSGLLLLINAGVSIVTQSTLWFYPDTG